MKVLFCTDGSAISYNSVINFSKWFKDIEVDIFCAADWSFLPDSIAVEDGDFALKCTNSADNILEYSEKLLEQQNIKIGEKIKMCGATVDSISEICENKNYDFIVLGSNGKKGIQKWLGSVSQEVASSSKISTYISKKENNAKKILFAVDGSLASKHMIKQTLEYFDFTDKEIHMATVYEVPDYLFLEGNIDSNWINEVHKKQETESMLIINEYDEIFNSENLSIKTKKILNGNPSSQIIKYTTDENIDLVVCCVRNRKALSKILLTSVSRRILENSISDVLLLKSDNL